MKILFLTQRLPYAPNRGDRIRSYHMLRRLLPDAEVHLASFVAADEIPHIESIRSWLPRLHVAKLPRLANLVRALLALFGETPLTHVLLDAPGFERQLAELNRREQFDLVLACSSGMARFAVKGPLAVLPCVIDMVDVDSEKWKALSLRTSPPMSWIYRREARVLAYFEAEAAQHARTTLVVSDREAHALRALAPNANVIVLSHGVDIEYFRARVNSTRAPNVVFTGIMDYAPNAEAATWFSNEVWPLVRKRTPGAEFLIVGARPTAAVRRLSEQAGITVTGSVDDMRPYLWRSTVAVAPLFAARGQQNKVLEAVAAGLPVVTTPVVAEGLPACVLPACTVISTPQEFAEAVVELLESDDAERQRRVAGADLSGFGCASQLQPLMDILERAVKGDRV
jgi:sugar transferase (PEP-CTERM/EpsH1 system associated)